MNTEALERMHDGRRELKPEVVEERVKDGDRHCSRERVWVGSGVEGRGSSGESRSSMRIRGERTVRRYSYRSLCLGLAQ